jgi:hypothetical protein
VFHLCRFGTLEIEGREMKSFPVPICTILFNPETGCYALSCRFEGRKPHFAMDTFRTLDGALAWALAWADLRQERIWEDASDADEQKIMVSRANRPGTVAWSCETLPARGI